jgi:uncharacterized membrane protein
MLWVILALIAYFLLAIVGVIDKKILSSPLLNPLAYAFYAGLLPIVAIIFWLFDFSFLSPLYTIFAILGGATFFVGIFFLFEAIIKGEISRVITIVGGISPILIFIFSYFFLGERLNFSYIVALFILIAGSISLSFATDGEKLRFDRYFFLFSFLAALFFSFSYFLTKAIFLKTSFLNGFVWIRVGTIFSSLGVFLVPSWRKRILQGSKGFSSKLTFLFLFNKGISGLSHLPLNYAVALGSVVIVNALQATEYAFIFVLTLGLSYFLPSVFHESLTVRNLVSKIIGIVLVSCGTIILFLGRT